MGKWCSKEKGSDELGGQRRDPHFLFKVRERLKVLESRTDMSNEEDTAHIFQVLALGTFAHFRPDYVQRGPAFNLFHGVCSPRRLTPRMQQMAHRNVSGCSQTAQLFFSLLTPVVKVYCPPAVFSARSMAVVYIFFFYTSVKLRNGNLGRV